MLHRSLFVAACAAVPAVASAQQYTVTGLGTLPGYTQSEAFGINASGQVAGTALRFDNGAPHRRAFLFSGGALTDLGTFAGDSEAFGINSKGQVVGDSNAPNSQSHAFLYSDATMSDLGTLMAGGQSYAKAINDAGQVVGYSNRTNFNAVTTEHAVLFGGVRPTVLDDQVTAYSSALAISSTGQAVGTYSPNSGANIFYPALFGGSTVVRLDELDGSATGINNSGQIVGTHNTRADAHAFLYDANALKDLGTLGGSYSYAQAINDAGLIVGGSQTAKSVEGHGIVFTHHGMFDLNNMISPASGWTILGANSVNDAGQIAGLGRDIAGDEQAVVLTPTRGTGPVIITGDANGDGVVDFNDLLVVAQSYGRIKKNARWSDGDFTGDGAVGFSDLLILAQHYGRTIDTAGTGTNAPVPEPMTFGILGSVAVPLIRRRRT